MHRHFLTSLLINYNPSDAEHDSYKSMRKFVDEDEGCFSRENMTGHITGSGWVVNKERSHAVLVHHKVFDKWFQPGGHSDDDPNPLCVAQKEVMEETGLLVMPVACEIFDVDAHMVKGRPHKGEVDHMHYDVRFLFEADMSQPLLVSDESNDVKWFPLAEIALGTFMKDESVIRMARKTMGIEDSTVEYGLVYEEHTIDSLND